MSVSRQNLFITELYKVGFPVISQMGKTIPIPELAPVMPWNMEERAIVNVRTRTVGNKFNVFLHLNQEGRGIPLPFGYATFEVVECGQLYCPGAYLSQTLTFSEVDLYSHPYREVKKIDLIKAQLEAVAIRFARSIEEIAFQTLFNQLNS